MDKFGPVPADRVDFMLAEELASTRRSACCATPARAGSSPGRASRSSAALLGGHLDVAGGRLRISREATKTDAGERVVPLVPALRERIVEHRMNYPTGPAEPALPTRNGTAQRPDDVRSRILAPRLRAPTSCSPTTAGYRSRT